MYASSYQESINKAKEVGLSSNVGSSNMATISNYRSNKPGRKTFFSHESRRSSKKKTEVITEICNDFKHSD